MHFELTDPFSQIALLLAGATVASVAAAYLRQPLIVVFIAVGFVVGPAVLGLVEASDTVELLGRIGVALLLFVVGLKLDPALIRSSGAVALVSGVGQVVITAAVGLLLTLAMGMAFVPAAYVSLALTFSSTVIVIKLLTDRREIDSLHGRIVVGILIIQDIMVMLALVVLAGIGQVEEGNNAFVELGITAARGGALLAIVTLTVRFLVPRIEDRIAALPEILVLGGVAWASGLAVAAESIGFSVEMGAFVAGISLAGRPPRQMVAARLTSLRDFLLLFFFIGLGAQIEVGDIREQIVPALVLSTFVLVGNPIIIFAIMLAMRFRTRTAFFSGVVLAQISEFSFIVMAMGLSLGHLDRDELATVTLVGLITFAISTYLYTYANRIYALLHPVFARLERSTAHYEEEISAPGSGLPEVLVFGTGRLGTVVLTRLRNQGIDAWGIDFDPIAVRRLQSIGFQARFGDAEDLDFIATLPLQAARIAISTVRVVDVELTLLRALRLNGFLGPIIVTGGTTSTVDRLHAAGATVVLLPYEAAGERATEMVVEALRDPTYLDAVRAKPRVQVMEEQTEP